MPRRRSILPSTSPSSTRPTIPASMLATRRLPRRHVSRTPTRGSFANHRSLRASLRGPVVTIAKGTGQPPAPAGGTIIPGDYQLASETVYGNVPTEWPALSPGGHIQRILHVEGDVVNQESLSTTEFSSGGGNDCSRLVPRALSLLEVARGCEPGVELRFLHDEGKHPRSRVSVAVLPICFALQWILRGSRLPHSRRRIRAGWCGTGNPARVDQRGRRLGRRHVGARPARCPDSPPSSGDPCTPDPAPLGCEYGGDAWRSCTTLALCEMDKLDGTFRFQVTSQSPVHTSGPPACPASFSAASALASTVVDAGTGEALDAAGAGCNRTCTAAMRRDNVPVCAPVTHACGPASAAGRAKTAERRRVHGQGPWRGIRAHPASNAGTWSSARRVI